MSQENNKYCANIFKSNRIQTYKYFSYVGKVFLRANTIGNFPLINSINCLEMCFKEVCDCLFVRKAFNVLHMNCISVSGEVINICNYS